MGAVYASDGKHPSGTNDQYGNAMPDKKYKDHAGEDVAGAVETLFSVLPEEYKVTKDGKREGFIDQEGGVIKFNDHSTNGLTRREDVIQLFDQAIEKMEEKDDGN